MAFVMDNAWWLFVLIACGFYLWCVARMRRAKRYLADKGIGHKISLVRGPAMSRVRHDPPPLGAA